MRVRSSSCAPCRCKVVRTGSWRRACTMLRCTRLSARKLQYRAFCACMKETTYYMIKGRQAAVMPIRKAITRSSVESNRNSRAKLWRCVPPWVREVLQRERNAEGHAKA